MTTRMLIVDDHAGFRAMASEIATSAGYDVVGEAADGAEALAEVARLHPDVVLLDVELPDMTGITVAERLADGADQPTVVLVSGRQRSELGSRLDHAPVVAFIGKEELSESALDAVLR